MKRSVFQPPRGPDDELGWSLVQTRFVAAAAFLLALLPSAYSQENSAVVLAGYGSASFSPDGQLLVTLGEARTGVPNLVKVWDVKTGKEKRSIPVNGVINQVAFGRDGKTLYVSGPGKSVTTWDADSGTALKAFGPTLGEVRQFALSPDGKLLFAMTDDGGSSKTIPDFAELKCWNTST